MKPAVLIFILIFNKLHSQSLADCKSRYEHYLCHHQTPLKNVRFNAGSVEITDSNGKVLYSVYENEIPALGVFFSRHNLEDQEKLMAFKGTHLLNAAALDSINATTGPTRKSMSGKIILAAGNSLKGKKIAIDPGHFGTTLKDAKAEQKYLKFKIGEKDILIFESELTFQTAFILTQQLREAGAEVMLTRSESHFTSFDCSFETWLTCCRKRALDSLLADKKITAGKHKTLLKASPHDFFWNFFRDFELANRAKKINDFAPDATAIIHYNVDEKNAPWKKPSAKDFTMCFIGGAFAGDDLDSEENKMHFLRLLLTDQLRQSEKISSLTVTHFHELLKVKIAQTQDASYLSKNCNSTGSAGVFCRNLVLCRKVNSPLFYGEALYQDNENECTELMNNTVEKYGIKTNSRVVLAADAYFQALRDYFSKQ